MAAYNRMTYEHVGPALAIPWWSD